MAVKNPFSTYICRPKLFILIAGVHLMDILYNKAQSLLEPKQFKNNLNMFEDKPQFEFCHLLAGSNFEVDAQKK